jgi:hypothetical protein
MKITNIGILNIQTATQETLTQCQEISNVGFMVGTDEAFEQIQPCRITNIGMTIKIPAGLPLVFKEDSLLLDDDFLSSLPEKTGFIVNGDCIVQTENQTLLQEKIHEIVINGNTYCPSSIKGLLSTLGRFNGRMIAYENGATFFEQPLLINETHLFRLPKRISTNRLRAFDPALAQAAESLASIEVLDSCWIGKNIFASWKNKLHLDLGAELQLLESPVRYHESDETFTIKELAAITESTLAIDGTLTITGDNFVQPEHLTTICCKTLRAQQEVINQLKPLLTPSVKAASLESNKRVNHGKLILSASQLTQLENPLRLENYASLIFDDSVTPDLIKKGIAQIENFGVVKAPEALMAIIMEKTVTNFGKIKPIELLKVEETKEYAYENLGYLAL